MRTKSIILLIIASFLFVSGSALATEEVSPSPSPSPSPSIQPVQLKPINSIVKYIGEKEAHQEIQIREIKGFRICQLLNLCPFENSEKGFTEVIIKAAKIKEIINNQLVISIFGRDYSVDLKEAKLLRQSWGNSDLDEFSVGDVVNVFGYLDENDDLLIHAKTIRDLSLAKNNVIVKGIVTEVGNNSFSIKTVENGTYNISLNSDTQIIKTEAVVCAQVVGIKCFGNISGQVDFSAINKDLLVIVRGNLERQDSILAELIITGIDGRPFFQNADQFQNQFNIQGAGFLEKVKDKIDEKTGFKERIQELQNRIIDMMQQVKSKEGKAE